jgi:hypothetical protein
MTTPTYASREDVLVALDTPPTTHLLQRLDRHLQSATESINSLCHRYFYPTQATRTFDWPQQGRRRFQPQYKLYLGEHGLITLDSLTVGGISVATGDTYLRPDDGPPFTVLEIDINADDLYQQGDTHQRAVSVVGLFGYQNEEDLEAELDGNISDSDSTLDVSDGGTIGVGDLLRIGTERLVVTARGTIDTGQDLGGDLDNVTSDTLVQVSDGTLFFAGEIILIGSEKMLIDDIAGNNLVVKRAQEGSVLAAHSTGADIFASRRFTVARGALGTTAAAHSDTASIYRFRFPALVRQLAIAYAEDAVLQEKAGYTRTSGSGDNQREARATGIKELRDRVYWAHGRTARMLSI